jgi:hypothetical protein
MSENKTATAELRSSEGEPARRGNSWEEAKAASRDALDRLDRVLSPDGDTGRP